MCVWYYLNLFIRTFVCKSLVYCFFFYLFFFHNYFVMYVLPDNDENVFNCCAETFTLNMYARID